MEQDAKRIIRLPETRVVHAGPPGPIGPPGTQGSGVTLPSIAALRAYNAVQNSGDVILVTSWYSNARKGGGQFEYVAADTTSADDGFLIIVDALARRWKRIVGPAGVDFFMSGAKGDGIIAGDGTVSGSDDSAAINKIFSWIRDNVIANSQASGVIARGGGGTFKADSTINAANIGDGRWEFDGSGTTIASRAAGKPAFDLAASSGDRILRLTIYGDPSALPAVGVFLCRVGSTSDDHSLIRTEAFGAYRWAARCNSGGENVYEEQCLWRNHYIATTADFYGSANDAITYLRYDPPVVPVSADSDGNKIIILKVAHGIASLDKVYSYQGSEADRINQRWTATRIDADRFSIPKAGVAVGPVVIDRYFKARFWSEAVADEDDTIVPYIGDGAFTMIIQGGQSQCPYGNAMLDTPGGRRRINTRLTAGIHDSFDSDNIAIASIVAATATFNTATPHFLAIGNTVYVKDTGQFDNDKHLYLVDTTPTASSITVTHIDGSAATLSDSGAAGTLRKQATNAGYGIHWLLGSTFETPKYENVHHEPGPEPLPTNAVNACNAMALIQNYDVLRDGGPAQPVLIKGMRFAEHTFRGVNGGFIADAQTVSAVIMSGDLNAPDLSNDFGEHGHKTGKMFRAWDGAAFVSPALWKVSGDLIVDPIAIDPLVDFNGRITHPVNGSVLWRAGPSPTTDATTNYVIPASESGTSYTNDNAVGQVDFTLPAAMPGLNYEFTCIEPQIIRVLVVPAGDDTIALGTTLGTAQIISTATQWTSIRLKAFNNRRWIVVGGNNLAEWTVT